MAGSGRPREFAETKFLVYDSAGRNWHWRPKMNGKKEAAEGSIRCGNLHGRGFGTGLNISLGGARDRFRMGIVVGGVHGVANGQLSGVPGAGARCSLARA